MSKQNLGWVYILTNPAFKDGMIKIGFTSRDTPQQRADELSGATGVPTKFTVVWAARMPDAQSVETKVHRLLQSKRSNNNREFFECHVHEAIEVIETVAGKTIVSKVDNRKKASNATKQPEKSVSSKSRQSKPAVKHKHRGLIGMMMILLLLFLGAMFVVGLNVEKKEQQAQSSETQSPKTSKSALTQPETTTKLPQTKPTEPTTQPEYATGASNRDVETAWLKIPSEIRDTLNEEQKEWQRQKAARCAKAANKSACERELNEARITYLRGFSIN